MNHTDENGDVFVPWSRLFTDREKDLITNCLNYAMTKPAGLPGHNLMIIIAKMYTIMQPTLKDVVVSPTLTSVVDPGQKGV